MLFASKSNLPEYLIFSYGESYYNWKKRSMAHANLQSSANEGSYDENVQWI